MEKKKNIHPLNNTLTIIENIKKTRLIKPDDKYADDTHINIKKGEKRKYDNNHGQDNISKYRNRLPRENPHKNKKSKNEINNIPSKVDQTFSIRQVINLFKRYQYEKYIFEGSSVLNLASGYSDEDKLSFRKISSYVGVDASPEALEEARSRTKTNPRFNKWVKHCHFIESDLRHNIIKTDPKVDVVICQLALHYMWGDIKHIENILSTIRESLKPNGLFICTVVDPTKISLAVHPLVKIQCISSPIVTTENKLENKLENKKEEKTDDKEMYRKKSYYFTFPGLITKGEEFVIEQDFLVSKCLEFNLKLLDHFSCKQVWKHISPFCRSNLLITDHDWTIIDLYKCFIFQRL